MIVDSANTSSLSSMPSSQATLAHDWLKHTETLQTKLVFLIAFCDFNWAETDSHQDPCPHSPIWKRSPYDHTALQLSIRMFASSSSSGVPKGYSSPNTPSHLVHPYLTQPHSVSKSSRRSSSTSHRSRTRAHHDKSGKMVITDSSTNQRMAIHTLLNDTVRDTPRSSGSMSSMKDYKCELCYKRFVITLHIAFCACSADIHSLC